MKKIINSVVIVFLSTFCSFGQVSNNLIQTNSTSVTILPSEISAARPTTPNNWVRSIALGKNALSLVNGGSADNNAIGENAMATNFQCNSNIAIGTNALQYSVYNSNNVAIGAYAFVSATPINSDGNNHFGNVSIGSGSMRNAGISGINRNVAIGVQTLNNLPSYAGGNIAIGYQAGYSETGSNKLYIENTNSNTPLIGGDFAGNKVGINRLITDISSASEIFQVQGNTLITGMLTVNATVYSSDNRLKKNITPLQSPLAQILQLRGVSYKWRKEEFPNRNFSDKLQVGFIAQEVEKIFPEMVETDAQGYKAVNYIQLTPVMVESIKELSRQIGILQNKNKDLEASIAGIFEQIKKEKSSITSK